MSVDECIGFYCALMRDLFPEKPGTWLERRFEFSQNIKGRALLNSQALETKIKELTRHVLGHDQEDARFEHPQGRCNV